MSLEPYRNKYAQSSKARGSCPAKLRRGKTLLIEGGGLPCIVIESSLMSVLMGYFEQANGSTEATPQRPTLPC